MGPLVAALADVNRQTIRNAAVFDRVDAATVRPDGRNQVRSLRFSTLRCAEAAEYTGWATHIDV